MEITVCDACKGFELTKIKIINGSLFITTRNARYSIGMAVGRYKFKFLPVLYCWVVGYVYGDNFLRLLLSF